MEVALGSNHSPNVLGVLDNFHFAKLLTTAHGNYHCHTVPNSTSDE